MPRAADTDAKNHVFVGWDGTTAGIQITRLDYTADGTLTQSMIFDVPTKSKDLIIRDIRYRVLNGTEYLYLLITDGKEGVDNYTQDMIYRYTVGESTLTLDKSFGVRGWVNTRLLSGRDDTKDAYLTELYAIDVDTDGTVYVSSNDGPMAAKLTKNGTVYQALWASNADDSKSQGAIAVVDRYVISPVNAGKWSKEGMAWSRLTGNWAFTRNSGRFAYGETMNCYTHMRYVNGTLYIADRGVGKATETVDENADKILMVKYDNAAYNKTVKTGSASRPPR